MVNSLVLALAFIGVVGWLFGAFFFLMWRDAVQDVNTNADVASDLHAKWTDARDRLDSAKGFARWAILPLLQAPDGGGVLVDKNALSLVLRDLGMDRQGNDLPPAEEESGDAQA